MSEIAKLEKAVFARFYASCAAVFERCALRQTGGVFCNSAYTEELVARRTRRTWRVPNALRLAFFENPLTLEVSSRPMLVNIGVISPRKRQCELLDLARDLHARGGKFVLKFVGAVDATSNYGKAFLGKLEIAKEAGYAEHLGTRDIRGLVELIDAASALLHVPSEEAFGLVVAEALARNLKLFATRVGGIVDIASEAEGAELFGPDDWPGLAAAIDGWLAAGAPRPTSTSELMRTRYHPVVIAQRHVEIYREVLNSRS